ncbi:6-hydroxy-D-nicotine oxidase [Apiospora hydei]|uniref:6-hydroxy-D-nicotine oxidase n=1 Tax=Apiospora hydei TaxID=1337664 RepID=A0ABR1UVX2_9PEZI
MSVHELQCQALVDLLGKDKVFLPGSDGYTESVKSYFSPQAAAVQPACFVTPQSPAEVSAVVKSLTSSSNCPFAVRGGGHEWFAGANSAPDGVTIDLRGLNGIELSDDKSRVTVGAGATWDAVYRVLDPLGLSVAGGQIEGVGVGGLTLGGGLSYFGPREGWTCDQVTRFEVVLADGSVVQAEEEGTNADLFWGLRGGSNNFGIVTSFTFRTFEQGELWSTLAVCPSTEADVDNQARVFARLMEAENYDVNAYFLTGWAFIGEHGITVATNQMVYTRPSGDEFPEFYKPALALQTLKPNMGMPPGVASMSALANRSTAFRPPQANRYLSATTTFIPTEAMIRGVYDAYRASVEKVAQVKGVHWNICIEPIPPTLYNNKNSDEGNGTNALGLATRTKTLGTLVISPSWKDAADDETVYDAARFLVAKVERKAKELGVYDPFLYFNYAAPWQEVMKSYGEDNIKKLQALRKRVDPGMVFTHQVKGGFKIPLSE